MPNMQEVYDMITKQTPPRIDPLEDQHRRERRHQRRRAIGAYTVTAMILVAVVVAVAAVRSPSTTPPASSDAPPLVGTTNLIAYDVASGTSSDAIADVGAFGAAVSPDGTRIAFTRTVQGHAQIFTVDVGGANLRQVTGLPSQPGCACGAVDPTWSPDGTEIAYIGENEQGRQGLWIVDRTGDLGQVAATDGDQYFATPAWSPDGTAIALVDGSWRNEPAGSGSIIAARITSHMGGPLLPSITDLPGAFSPTWSSRDGSVAFQASVPGGTALFVAANPDRPARRITDGTDDSAPAFSPDGTQVAFVRNGAVSILDLATGNVRTLGPGNDPAWSPDGSTIYAWHTS